MTASSPLASRVRLSLFLGTLSAALLASALVIVQGVNLDRTEAVVDALANHIMADVGTDTGRIVHDLIDPVAASLRMIAAVEGTSPGIFRDETSVNILYRALTAAPQIDAVYTTFEDGFHRAVTRIDNNRRRRDPRIPVAANWHSSWVNPFQDGVMRRRNRTFYDTWPHAVARYGFEESTDQRQVLWQYREAKRTGHLAISDPVIDPDTGFPMLVIGYPIMVGGELAGVASANITMKALSEFLQERKASPNSITAIVDADGLVVAYPDTAQMARTSAGKLEVRKATDLADVQVVRALAQRGERNSGRFTFTAGPNDADYIAVFSPLPALSDKKWLIAVVAPVDDFLGGLRQDRWETVLVFAVLVVAMFVAVTAACLALLRRYQPAP